MFVKIKYDVGVMLKKLLEIISNPLLYYVDKEGNCVFRNYCFVKETGNLYRTSIPKSNVGKALEFRFDLDKKLKWVYFLTPVVLYFIFIQIKFSLLALLLFEILWIGIITLARLFCSYLYREYLITHFGKYEITEFRPPITQEKYDSYVSLLKSKVLAVIIVIALFFVPSFIMTGVLKLQLKSKRNLFKQAVSTANTYFALYPKNETIYDLRAYAKFMSKDYEGALQDYKSVLNMSGKKFSKKDYVRFANLLYLQKKMSTSQEAVDVFNEYVTKKKMSTLQESQMLWVKSIFKIENNIPETIVQEYNDLLASLDSKDVQNRFYISSDMAYMYYLMEEYVIAISAYNTLIAFASQNQEKYANELKSLYAERGWAKKRSGDEYGANADFVASGIDYSELNSYEPKFANQQLVKGF